MALSGAMPCASDDVCAQRGQTHAGQRADVSTRERNAWQKPPPTFAEWSKSDDALESACAVRCAGRVWVEYGDAEYLVIEDSLSTATPDEVKAQALATRAQCGYANTTAYSDSVWATPMLSFPDDDDASDDEATGDPSSEPDAAGSHGASASPASAGRGGDASSDEASDSEDDRLPPPPISRDELEASMYVHIFPSGGVHVLDELQHEHDESAGKRARECAEADAVEAKRAKFAFSFGAPPHVNCAAAEAQPGCAGASKGCSA